LDLLRACLCRENLGFVVWIVVSNLLRRGPHTHLVAQPYPLALTLARAHP